MTTLQQEQILQTGRLYLTKSRTFRHFSDPLIISVISLFFIYYIVEGFVDRTGQNNSHYLLIFLIFPLFAVYLFIKQWASLKLKVLLTDLSKQDNYKMVKETLRILQWHIKVDNKGFIEAYAETNGLWTWEDQMISIIITDNKVLFNSIVGVDTFSTQAISWGQNARNIKRFKKTFELIATKHIG
jgi:hypothetical protein